MSVVKPHGLYFLFPEGSGWIAAEFVQGTLTGVAEESESATHQAARDRWADATPQEADTDVLGSEADAVVSAVVGPDAVSAYVCVTRRKD